MSKVSNSNISRTLANAGISAGLTLTSMMAGAATADKVMLEEIIVTAQKREERLQDVPIAISALTIEQMERYRLVDTNSIANFVPNLHTKNGVGSDVTVAIRGVSNNNTGNIGFESAVGWYMDGVYFGKGLGTLFDLGDIARVEVLRGPQGTLYGRNTIGGAVNLISTRPSGEFSGKLKGGLGNSSLVETSLAIDTPSIGQEDEGLGTLSARVSYFSRDREGFTRNVAQNLSVGDEPVSNVSRFGEIDHEATHIAVDWNVRSNFKIAYDYIASEADDTPRLFQLIEKTPGLGTTAPGFEGYTVEGFPSIGTTNNDVHNQAEIDSHSVIMTWDINDKLTLKSITATRETNTDELLDLDGGGTGWYVSDNINEHEQFSQELQLLVNYDTVQFVGGLFYYEEDVELLRMLRFLNGGFMQQVNNKADNENYAAFGQVDWNITDAWSVSFGVRYTEETKQMNRYIRVLPAFYQPFGAVPTSYDDPTYGLILPEIELDDTSIMVSTSYQITEQINVYGKYSEGFRSGGYDGQTSNPLAAAVPFDSEQLKSYEIGAKSMLFDNRLQLNVAAFYNDYSDMQIGRFNGAFSVTDNAGEVNFTGFELEAKAAITESLSANITYSFLDYDIKEYDLGTVVGDVSDAAEINNAPENSFSVSLDYNVAEINGAPLDVLLNYVNSDGAHALAITGSGQAPNAFTDDYERIDARIMLSQLPLSPSVAMTVALWGKNLTDEENIDNIIDWGGFGGFRTGTTAWPRTYGLEVSFDF